MPSLAPAGTGRLPAHAGAQKATGSAAAAPNQTPLQFVCEEDVRLALQAGRKLVVAERAIVTPAARELGEEHRVFSVAAWRE